MRFCQTESTSLQCVTMTPFVDKLCTPQLLRLQKNEHTWQKFENRLDILCLIDGEHIKVLHSQKLSEIL